MITLLICIGSVFIVLLLAVLAVIIYRIRHEKVKKIFHQSRNSNQSQIGIWGRIVAVTDESEIPKRKDYDTSVVSLMNNETRPEF